MGASNSLVATLLAMAGQRNVITIPRAFVRFTGDIESAMLLNQLLYWMPRSHLDGESIYKTDSDWQEELCLTRYAVRKARESLVKMGFLTTSVHHQKGTPAVHYHIDYELLIEKWETWLQDNGVKSENEIDSGPSKVRKRTLPFESSSNPDTVKSESRQTMNHRVPTENVGGVGGGAHARVAPIAAETPQFPRHIAYLYAHGMESADQFAHLDPDAAIADFNARLDAGYPIGTIVNRWKKHPPAPGDIYAKRERAAGARPDPRNRQPDKAGTANPERGPVRTTLEY